MSLRKYDGYIIHTGTDASLHFPNEAYVFTDLKDGFTDNERVTVEIKTRRTPRTLKQNAYLHMCLQMISDETGNTLDRVKTTLKDMYARKPLLDKDGEQIYNKDTGEQAFYIQDTSDMDTLESMVFTENVRMFAIDFVGLILPLPEQQIKAKF